MILPLVHKMAKAEKELEENFESNGKKYLVRCPRCERENWALSVSSGRCAWCGYDANNSQEDKEQ